MDKYFEKIIDNIKDEDSWSGVICLFSGLYDEKNDRESFIIKIADSNVHLAAKCETESIYESLATIQILKKKSKSLDFNSIAALIEIGELDLVASRFKSLTKLPKKFLPLMESLTEYFPLETCLHFIFKIEKNTIRGEILKKILENIIRENSNVIFKKEFQYEYVKCLCKWPETIKYIHLFKQWITLSSEKALKHILNSSLGKPYATDKIKNIEYALSQYKHIQYSSFFIKTYLEKMLKSKSEKHRKYAKRYFESLLKILVI